jgi:hypothetical protein
VASTHSSQVTSARVKAARPSRRMATREFIMCVWTMSAVYPCFAVFYRYTFTFVSLSAWPVKRIMCQDVPPHLLQCVQSDASMLTKRHQGSTRAMALSAVHDFSNDGCLSTFAIFQQLDLPEAHSWKCPARGTVSTVPLH